MENSATALKSILTLSDKLRDVDLVPLGVALDDQEGKFVVVHVMLASLTLRDRWEGPCQTCIAIGFNQSQGGEARHVGS